jgi:hypothetical protein
MLSARTSPGSRWPKHAGSLPLLALLTPGPRSPTFKCTRSAGTFDVVTSHVPEAGSRCLKGQGGNRWAQLLLAVWVLAVQRPCVAPP